MKDMVKILLMGDEGVGKSSLLSTFISRHFPQEVPHVVSDTNLPADVVAEGANVTIMDSSARLNDRELLRSKIQMADSFILLHDVTRPETFDNILHIWIPLIKEVLPPKIRKPFLLLGTKIDLIHEDDTDIFVNVGKEEGEEEELDIDILFCLYCSAVRLQYIDNLFHLAGLVVFYPVIPIYDPREKEFTPLAYQAFCRIFRILDYDGDNLLNDDEILALEINCFDNGFDTMDLINIKRSIEDKNREGISPNGEVTFLGFMEIFKIAMEKENFQTPWVLLRYYHYDDDLTLQIPSQILTLKKLKQEQSYQLSDNAIKFLSDTARNAYAENTRPIKSAGDSDSSSELEDCLTTEALKSIFAILPKEYYENHPWMNPPSYQSRWPHDFRQIDPIEQCTLLNRFPHDNALLSFDAWLIQWNILAFTEPLLVQKFLFLLGYVDREDFGIVVHSGNIYTLFKRRQQQMRSSLSKHLTFWRKQTVKTPAAPLSITYSSHATGSMKFSNDVNLSGKKQMINICILGDNDVGKSSFVWYLSGLRLPRQNNPFFMEDDIVEKSIEYEKAYENILVGGSLFSIEDEPSIATSLSQTALTPESKQSGAGSPTLLNNSPSPPENTDQQQSTGTTVYFSLSSIPMEHVKVWTEKCVTQYDLILLMFSCDSVESVTTLLTLEKALPTNIPRLYLCSKMDLLHTPIEDTAVRLSYEKNLETMNLHIQENELPPICNISTLSGEGIIETVKQIKALYQSPELGILKPIKRKKTFAERVLQFFWNPRSIFATDSGTAMEDEKSLRAHKYLLFLISTGVIATASYVLIQKNPTFGKLYRKFVTDVQNAVKEFAANTSSFLPPLQTKYSGSINENQGQLISSRIFNEWTQYAYESWSYWNKPK